MNKIEFGYKYKDIITGFEGIVTDRAMYITGCDRVGLTNTDGEVKFFNDNIIKFVDEGVYYDLKKAGCNKYNDLEEGLYDFGVLATDKISEYKGKIVAKQLGISGDISYALSQKYDNRNKDNDASWFDEGRIEVISDKKDEIKTDKKRTGGVSNPHNLRVR